MKRTSIAAAIAALFLAASGAYAQTSGTGSTAATGQSGRSGGNATAIGSTATGAAVPGSTAAVPGSTAADRSAPGAASAMGNMAGGSGKLAAGDRKFVMEAAEGGMKEVEFGRVAADKASDPAVKQFADRMVRDHSEADKKLMDVAQSKGVTPPPKIKSSDQRTLDKLSKMSGDKFDRAYMDDMVKDHQKDVKDFQKEAKSGKDPEVKGFAADTLPVLEEHLRLALDTQSKVKGGKGSSAAAKSTTGK